MLNVDDIRVDTGRASHSGDFRRMIHLPTGIIRYHPGPMHNVNWEELKRQWLREIEAEVLDRGLSERVVTTNREKDKHADRHSS